ncbi:hypothetical protein ANN_01703 [Periplaneta americana]|uniref:Uncharacterized protein n=1 Tax=Periplaneta americana TaxID=6978 RepID=A0ABQ8TUE0_PERAM|nr:hypothetical protein ANN_01703 [Periplaneta americana]
MAGLCEGGNEPPGSLKASKQCVSQSKQASLVYRSSTRVCVRNCVSIRRPEFECSGPQVEGPEFECSGPQLEGPEFEYSGLSLKRGRSVDDQRTNVFRIHKPVLAIYRVFKNTGHNFRSLPSKETLREHSDSSFRGEGYIQCCVGVRLCDMYSNQELAEIHFMYGKADGNAALARRLCQERYPQRQCPDRKTFALSPADYPARVRFCQWFLQQCGVNPNFPALVLFTDEAQFTRDGITNFHNQHVWAYENPRATVPCHHQVRFSLNMWTGIIGDRLVGPHVLVNRLTGQAYTNFLENTISHVLEDTPLINRQHIHFLHDGAPAHFSRTARRYLDRRFPDRCDG